MSNPQRLTPRQADICEHCGRKVYFAVDQTKPAGDGQHIVQYSHCPFCNHPGTRIIEAASTARKRRAILSGRVIAS